MARVACEGEKGSQNKSNGQIACGLGRTQGVNLQKERKAQVLIQATIPKI